MLLILLNYGAELGLPGCLDLAQVLERMILRVPQTVKRAWKAARPKKTGMTYDQAAAIVAEGLRRGTRRHRSVGVAAQFELTTRQVDVIGYWERIDRASALTIAASLYLKIEINGSALASRNPQRNGRCGNRRASSRHAG
jgi:hypothetical protein